MIGDECSIIPIELEETSESEELIVPVLSEYAQVSDLPVETSHSEDSLTLAATPATFTFNLGYLVDEVFIDESSGLVADRLFSVIDYRTTDALEAVQVSLSTLGMDIPTQEVDIVVIYAPRYNMTEDGTTALGELL